MLTKVGILRYLTKLIEPMDWMVDDVLWYW